MFGSHGHWRESGDTSIDRGLDRDRREEDVPDDAVIEYGDEGGIVAGAAQRVHKFGLERLAKCELIRLSNARLIAKPFESHGNQRHYDRGFGPMNAIGAAATRIATTMTNASGPIGQSSASRRRVPSGASVRQRPIATPAR